MEVVSTSKLDSSETEKTTTACNFQLDYAMGGLYEYESKNMQIWSYSYFHDSINVKKHPKKHIHKTEKSKLTSHKLKEEVRFILKMHYSSEQKKSDK